MKKIESLNDLKELFHSIPKELKQEPKNSSSILWNDKMWISWIQIGIYPKYFLKRLIVAKKRDLDYLGYYKGVHNYRANSKTFT